MQTNRKVILILGQTGTGKSTLSKGFFRKGTRVVVIDPLHEYAGGQNFFSAGEMLEHHLENTPKYFRYCLQSTGEQDTDLLFRFCWTIGNVLLIVEEADIYLGRENRYFDPLVNQGRHRNVHICSIVRRTPEVNRGYRAQLTSLFSFRQSEPEDVRLISKWGLNETDVLGLQPVVFPASPVAGVNYVCVGEDVPDITFGFTQNLSPRLSI